ncbi:hypothetical protein CO683_39810 [Bradyrhizobium ottawaense]|nr:hypothetical protein [Bradyrhizobium sp. CCBAU 25360]MDA9452116.1 hypothetical protein [Bradyrhizobium sp. CCBAU 21360]MDA9453269.1 hypothetical protein [Bradyrhizobium sp. CCBAU 21359]MDA9485660.1 hypothetical protein [Bradyrhizobium sp. CCBAU 11445]MDA9512613.1 hypothetical protein [Bradyrhizobium sp. CCBAU 11430]PDT64170.1 hypothetical protein CO683_39810 [Bradyrhizobium ottawaense]
MLTIMARPPDQWADDILGVNFQSDAIKNCGWNVIILAKNRGFEFCVEHRILTVLHAFSGRVTIV